ncbi:MAG: hypothetical protein R3D67_07700 [Hyphomicrobiaceae bacterium]
MTWPTDENVVAVVLFATVNTGCTALSVAVAELLAGLPSLVAPVVPLTSEDPDAVGVPVTVHVMTMPALSELTGVVGEHVALRPAGSPATEQVAFVAAMAGELALVHVYVPL